MYEIVFKEELNSTVTRIDVRAAFGRTSRRLPGQL